VALDRAARLIREQFDERRCVASPLGSPRSSGGGLSLRGVASVEPFEQRVAIEAQSRPASLARQPDDTELGLVGVDEVAINGEQPSDLGHGEELAGRSLQELDDAVGDGLDVLMLEGHELVLADEKPRMIQIP
jgi:hypothetical protein